MNKTPQLLACFLAVAVLGITSCSSGGSSSSSYSSGSGKGIDKSLENQIKAAKQFKPKSDKYEYYIGSGSSDVKVTFTKPLSVYSALPFSTKVLKENFKDGAKSYSLIGKIAIYNLDYSTVIGTSYTSIVSSSGSPDIPNLNQSYIQDVVGLKTTKSQFDKLGDLKATYDGTNNAFRQNGNSTQLSSFVYTIDFATDKGTGKITGFGGIDLAEATLNRDSASITGVTSKIDGKHRTYKLEFFGPKAEEVAGKVFDETGDKDFSEIGLVGKRN